MKKEINGFLYWTPRILSIIFIGFLVLMSLDVVSPELSPEQVILGLFVHNIPALVMLIVLLVAWKYEIIGGIAFLLAGFFYLVLVGWAEIPWFLAFPWILTVSGPTFLIGVLFLAKLVQKTTPVVIMDQTEMKG